jgi:hypothetical protein
VVAGVSAGGVSAGVVVVPGVVVVSFAGLSRGPQALIRAAAAHSGIQNFMLMVAP